ncbi:MAG: hypothetical protein KDF65_16735 [Anaerolineae bacterium]|nr:hypothetical protein [Anaerolineae bacterium]
MVESTPVWVMELVKRWRDLLLLHEWEINIKLAAIPCSDGAGYVRGCVNVYPDIMRADIQLNEDIAQAENDEERGQWEVTIIHELLHVRMGRLSDFVERDLLPELSPSASNVASGTLRRELEPLVETLARILHRFAKPDEVDAMRERIAHLEKRILEEFDANRGQQT